MYTSDEVIITKIEKGAAIFCGEKLVKLLFVDGLDDSVPGKVCACIEISTRAGLTYIVCKRKFSDKNCGWEHKNS